MAESIPSWLCRVWGNLCLSVRLPTCKYTIQREMVLPKLCGVSLRHYREEDFEDCRMLYDLNAKGAPKGGDLSHIFFLRNHPTRNLVAVLDEKIIGCVSYLLPNPDYSVFILGLVHPNYQRMGVGRLLLYGWIAQMPEIESMTTLQVFPSNDTWDYFEQYGFEKSLVPWKDLAGKEHPYSATVVNTFIIQAARLYLQMAKVRFSDLSVMLPTHQYLMNEPSAKTANASFEGEGVPVYEH